MPFHLDAKIKKISTFCLKLLLSGALLLFLIRKANIHEMIHAAYSTRFGFLLIGVLLYPLGQIVCAIRWKLLAHALKIERDLKHMTALYFIGMFFNLFLPTSIGGDFIRIIYLTPSKSRMTRSSFLSVLAEGVTGIISTLPLASAAMLSSYGAPLPSRLRFWFPIFSGLIVLFLCTVPFFVRYLPQRMYLTFDRHLRVFWEKPLTTILAILYSTVFYAIVITIHVCIAHALSLRIAIPYLMIMIPLGSLSGLFPSVNGIGTRDAAYVYLLTRIGIDSTHALLFSLMWFFVLALSSLIGCIVYLIRGLSPEAAEIEAGSITVDAEA